ncbi:ParA family protein [Carnobacterium maltaromaticum]|uniref:ParA family protein n=1 Tax=Carnobacterium maltaromaticum TaxID=2751 RepID=UPI00295E267D|nr:ParA family protein [Carnobacterium maltaromaticum]
MSKTSIIGTLADKGGVGKTTIIYNKAEHDAANGKKVLLIDGDENRHLSSIYNNYQNTGTVMNCFSDKEEVEFVHVKENLDLIPGSKELGELNTQLATATNKETKFFMWLLDHADELEQYDRIYIDLHPNMSIITKNFLIVCDLLLCPVEPHKFSFEGLDSAKINLEKFRKEMIDFRSRETLVKAQLMFIGNKVKYNTSSSHSFKKVVDERDDFLGFFWERNLMATSTSENIPIVDMLKDDKLMKDKSTKDYLIHTEQTLEQISKYIDLYV